MVGFTVNSSLDWILEKYNIAEDIGLLVIDIDSDDYHVFNAIKNTHPEVVLVEYNPAIPNEIDVVQKKGTENRIGASLAALIRLGKEKGYEPVFVTDTNIIFVNKIEYPKLGIQNNSINSLRPYNPYEAYVLKDYLGNYATTGNTEKIWVSGNIPANINEAP
jgi:hypothetical protein